MNLFLPNWPRPSNIGALTTTRIGGKSLPPFNENNLGLHVGDTEIDVLENRMQLKNSLQLPNEPVWLEQIHSNRCIVAEDDLERTADAAVTRSAKYPLVIMTADCLPILLCNKEGSEIAAIHSGWRGLANGIIENTLKKMHSNPEDLIAWTGPAICGNCYEVGEEVLDAYRSQYSFAAQGFKPHGDKQLLNLAKIAEFILQAQGVSAVTHSNACTKELEHSFYSYRRQAQTGRMATLIWIKQDN